MNNIELRILGSTVFTNIINELEFNYIVNSNSTSNNNKKIVVTILFVENLKIKEVNKYLLSNEPIILFSNHKNFIKSCFKHSREVF